MFTLLGEYPCSIDPKGRVRIPSALLKQLPQEDQHQFVLSRGFEKCLVLYPMSEWQKVTARINKLDVFKKNERNLVRYFYRGATMLQVDNTERIHLPRHLMDYAEIKGEVLLAAQRNLIELWNQQTYEQLMEMDSDHFADLADQVMGQINTEED